jgi:hypothetical protein
MQVVSSYSLFLLLRDNETVGIVEFIHFGLLLLLLRSSVGMYLRKLCLHHEIQEWCPFFMYILQCTL